MTSSDDRDALARLVPAPPERDLPSGRHRHLGEFLMQEINSDPSARQRPAARRPASHRRPALVAALSALGVVVVVAAVAFGVGLWPTSTSTAQPGADPTGSGEVPSASASPVDPATWVLPVDLADCDYTVTNGFGNNFDPYPSFHNGVDLACPGSDAYQQPVYAAHAGLVTFASTGCPTNACVGYGNHVLIYDAADGVQLVYGHADSVVVSQGQQVSAGDLLGYIGWTGDVYPQSAAGAHLHFEIDVVASQPALGADIETGAIDPAPYLAARGVTLP